jgi:di/tricarboxylate transporter
VNGLYLAELIRGTHVIPAVGPDEVLEDGDILVFVGDLDRVVELQQLTGLAPPVGATPEVRRGERFYQAVVAANGELSGNTLKATDFRRRFGAAVIAVHREGQPLAGRLGDLVLRAGDLLLVVSDDGFEQRARATADLLIATPVGAATPTRRKHARVVELVVLAVVVLSATNVLDLTEAAIAGAGFLVATRILTPGEARRSLDIEVLVTIAASISLGTAVASTGLAEIVADGLVGFFDTWGHAGVILGVLLATMFVTEVASNNAAAVLVFPIALEISGATGIPLDALAMAILIGASCSYLTPIGYQTNLMVWGMGGYRFGDFARLGAPLTLLTILTTIIAIPLAFEI